MRVPPAWVVVVMATLALASCDSTYRPPYVSPDAGKRDGSVKAGFLAPCATNGECESGQCADFGGVRRCTRACGSGCPTLAGWTCGTGGSCQCLHVGKQADKCNTDGDCDGVPDRTPKAETCNGEDDDCNGTVDDVEPGTAGATLYFRDADGDGYGDLAQKTWLCAPKTGFVTQAGDCDDARKEDNPAAPEVCGDKFDNNCNGRVEDVEVCGLQPFQVDDVTKNDQGNAVLTSCPVQAGVDATVDLTEILGKQDQSQIKFTLRVADAPATGTCSSYKLTFGDPKAATDDLVYVYRLAAGPCGTAGLPLFEAFEKGKPFASAVKVGFFPNGPGGHVSFTIPKSELYARVPDPTYRLRACTNLKADALKDITDCATDTCTTPVHR